MIFGLMGISALSELDYFTFSVVIGLLGISYLLIKYPKVRLAISSIAWLIFT